jgi:tellurite resistance protein TerC
LDFINSFVVGNNIYSFIWLIFTLLIGIALALDIGVLDKVKRSINKRITKNSNKSKSLSQEESEVIIPLYKDSSSLKQQQEQQQHTSATRRALLWTILWISLAGIFAAIVYLVFGQDMALLFVTGYALEKSLSVDNMFVFLLIFSSLGIPYIY